MKSRRMRWVEHVANIWEIRHAYKISVRKPEGKKSLSETQAQMGG
jgi:hypothetical protein